MRDNHLSFAKVLQKRKQASVKQLRVYRLKDLVQQYEDDPDGDYTIYLGKRDENDQRRQRREKKQKGFEGQEGGFDGWLQKQSAFKSNKENRSFQEKNITKIQQQKTHFQSGFSPKSKDNKLRNVNYMPKQQRNNSNKLFNRSQMDRNQDKQPQKHLQIQNQHSQTDILASLNDHEQINNHTQMEQLIAGTQTIHKQIAQLAKTLIRQNVSLFEDEKFPQQQYQATYNQTAQLPRFAHDVSKQDKIDARSSQDPHKKRFQSAKHQLQGYLDKFIKNKTKQNHKQIFTVSPVSTQIVVGFSFSPQITFINQQSQQNELHINHIYQAQSEFPSQTINDTKFNELKKNFPTQQTLKIENQNIINIESVQYNNDAIAPQNKINDNIPQISKQTKLMPSAQMISSQRQHKKGAFMEIEEIFEMKKIIKNDEHLQTKSRGGPFSTKVNHQQKPLNQKLSLISHNKPKQNPTLTNKTSPKLKLINIKQPKTQITQFASSSSPKQPQQTNISSSNEGSRGTKKSIRDVKYSIVNPNVLHPSNKNSIDQQNKCTFENKNISKNIEKYESHKNSNINIRFNYQSRENSSVQSLFYKKQQKQTISFPKLQQTQTLNKKPQQRQKYNKSEIPNNPNPSNCTQSSESSEFIFDI